ncbi:MAG: roadblock/LC7 domain-containing protein [Methanosarcinaceae archaeon]
MVIKKEMLDKVLFDLESAGGVELSAIISKHGLLMVSTDSDTFSNETFAAVTATLYMSAESTTIRLSDELPKSIVIETGTKHIITVKAGSEALLVVLADNAYSLGLILNDMKSAGKKIARIL